MWHGWHIPSNTSCTSGNHSTARCTFSYLSWVFVFMACVNYTPINNGSLLNCVICHDFYCGNWWETIPWMPFTNIFCIKWLPIWCPTTGPTCLPARCGVFRGISCLCSYIDQSERGLGFHSEILSTPCLHVYSYNTNFCMLLIHQMSEHYNIYSLCPYHIGSWVIKLGGASFLFSSEDWMLSCQDMWLCWLGNPCIQILINSQIFCSVFSANRLSRSQTPPQIVS